MNKHLSKTLFLMLAVLAVLVVGCSDDDEGGSVGIVPAISTISPTEGPVGTVVTITGINLGDATSVTFGNVAATITENTATSIITAVPVDAEEGEQTITVTTAGGKGTKMFTVTATVPDAPTITSISPESLAGVVGSTVTITGTNLAGAGVLFGEIAATVDEASTDTALIFTVPEGAETGKITITTAGGAVESAAFTILHAPTITSVSPESLEGEVGSEVTITGENLEDAEVYFGEVLVTEVSASSATEITFTIPGGAETGTITIKTAGGEVETEEFTIVIPSDRYYVYDDNTIPNFSNFLGHGHSVLDRTNAEVVFEGESAIKVTFNYNGWGDFGFVPSPVHGGVMSTEGFTEIVVSVYAMPGAAQLNFWLKEQGAANADIIKRKLPVVEGEWKTFTVPLSDLGSKTDGDASNPTGAHGPINFIELKFGATTTGGDASDHTYYIDEIYFQ